MGGAVSKASKAVPRKYPSNPPSSAAKFNPTLSQTGRPGSNKTKPPPLASEFKDQSITKDAYDPQLGSNLRHLGAVHPSPTISYSSTADAAQHGMSSREHATAPDHSKNPAIQLLVSRERLAAQAEQELASAGRKGFQGREFLNVDTLKQILVLRDEHGSTPSSIEQRLGLKKGTVARLGPEGVVGAT